MQILRKLAPLLVPRLLSPLSTLGIKTIFGRFLASISAQVWRNITKNTKNADFKKTVPPAGPPFTVPPCPPWGSKIFGRFLASISAQVWRNITKNTKNADFKKTGPPAGPVYCPPCPPRPPWGSKNFLGGFWHLFQLKFEEMSPKILRIQILGKLSPLLSYHNSVTSLDMFLGSFHNITTSLDMFRHVYIIISNHIIILWQVWTCL